ncbi:hypothetical protein EZY14_005660 [Kordia sp. TARA_039_SRF]|nr:hypothetical protein EZY14_005660 [Kordia sp. TARA_039_SRF]
MKKKRSIEKLSFQKETISKLNEVTGGVKITTTIVTITPAVSEGLGGSCVDSCDCPNKTYNWMICVADYTEDC